MGSFFSVVSVGVTFLFGSGCNSQRAQEDIDVPVTESTVEEAPVLINPSTACTPYPSDRILSEISIEYAEGTAPDPDEVEQIERILTLAPYRFTQGLSRVVIEQSATCEGRRGHPAVGSINYPSGRIWLCRAVDPNRENPNELGGAFLGFDQGDFTRLEQTLIHEIGHYVDYKSPGLLELYIDHLSSIYPEFTDLLVDSGQELFANDVARYLLARKYLELFSGNELPIQNRWGDGVSGPWLRDRLFCGEEYDLQSAYWQLNYALHFLEGCSDPAKALDEFWVMFDRFPESGFLPQTMFGAGRTYEECYEDEETAFRIYRQALLEHPDHLMELNTMFMLNKVDNYYHHAYQDGASLAIEFYVEFIGRHPESRALGQALYFLGSWYYETGDCDNATIAFIRLVENYHDSTYANFEATQRMLEQCQE